jgi:nucleotide-binding universal stress UspA family protein
MGSGVIKKRRKLRRIASIANIASIARIIACKSLIEALDNHGNTGNHGNSFSRSRPSTPTVTCITCIPGLVEDNEAKGEMTMTNKVLVAIDGSGISDLAVDTLAAKLRPQEAEILVLQVVEPMIYSVPPEMSPGYTPELMARKHEDKERAMNALAYAAEVLRKAGFKVESRLVESEIKEGILAVAGEWGANLIVVTSHARHGMDKFLHRSVAEGIVHRSPCAVLVLKEMEKQAA